MSASAAITLHVREKEGPVQHHFYCERHMEPENALVAFTSAAIRGARINGHDGIEGMTEPLEMSCARFSRLAHWRECHATDFRYELWDQSGRVWVEALTPRADAPLTDDSKNFEHWDVVFRGSWEEFDRWSEGKV